MVNEAKKMKVVGWIGDASKNLFKWGGKEAKKEAAHDADEFTRIIEKVGVAPTTSVEDVEEWLGKLDDEIKKMKHSPAVEIPTKMLFQKFFKPMLKHLDLEPHSPATPELEKTLGIAAGSIGLGLAAYAAGMVVETISLGQIDGFDKFWDQVVSATGIYRISRLLTSLPLELALLRPMGYQYNEFYQTFKPKIDQATMWYGRGHIGDEGYKEFMRWHGIEPQWFDPYKRFASRETSYFMLNAIAREGLYDAKKFQFWLSDAGYGAYTITADMLTEYERDYGLTAPEETQIDFLLDNYKKMGLKAEYSGIQSVAQKMWLRGEITEEEFDGYLINLGKPDEVRDLIIKAAKLGKQASSRELSLGIISRLYRIGRISAADFTERLKAFGYTDSGIAELIELEDLKKQEDPKSLTRANLEGMYIQGTIDESTLRTRLTELDYTDADVNLILQYIKDKQKEEEEPGVKERTRDLSLSIISQLYRMNRITEEEFKTRLIAMGYDAAEASDIIALENLRKQEDPPTLTRGQLEGMFRRKIVDEPEFRTRLKNMNYGDRDINLMVDDNLSRMET